MRPKYPILPLFSQILYKAKHKPLKLISNHLQVMAHNNRTLYLPQAHSNCDVLQNTNSQIQTSFTMPAIYKKIFNSSNMPFNLLKFNINSKCCSNSDNPSFS